MKPYCVYSLEYSISMRISTLQFKKSWFWHIYARLYACNKQHCQSLISVMKPAHVQILNSDHVQNLSCEKLWLFQTLVHYDGIPVFHTLTQYTFYLSISVQVQFCIQYNRQEIKGQDQINDQTRKIGGQVTHSSCFRAETKAKERQASQLMIELIRKSTGTTFSLCRGGP